MGRLAAWGLIGIAVLSLVLGVASGSLLGGFLVFIILAFFYVMLLGAWNLSGKTLKALDGLSAISQLSKIQTIRGRYCIECGKLMAYNVPFCSYCGTKQP